MQLLREGLKLAVLGVDDSFGGDRRWWHVVKPGSYSTPQLAGSENLAHGTALCGRVVATNGYPSDFRPPIGSLCPACKERN